MNTPIIISLVITQKVLNIYNPETLKLVPISLKDKNHMSEFTFIINKYFDIYNDGTDNRASSLTIIFVVLDTLSASNLNSLLTTGKFSFLNQTAILSMSVPVPTFNMMNVGFNMGIIPPVFDILEHDPILTEDSIPVYSIRLKVLHHMIPLLTPFITVRVNRAQSTTKTAGAYIKKLRMFLLESDALLAERQIDARVVLSNNTGDKKSLTAFREAKDKYDLTDILTVFGARSETFNKTLEFNKYIAFFNSTLFGHNNEGQGHILRTEGGEQYPLLEYPQYSLAQEYSPFPAVRVKTSSTGLRSVKLDTPFNHISNEGGESVVTRFIYIDVKGAFPNILRIIWSNVTYYQSLPHSVNNKNSMDYLLHIKPWIEFYLDDLELRNSGTLSSDHASEIKTRLNSIIGLFRHHKSKLFNPELHFKICLGLQTVMSDVITSLPSSFHLLQVNVDGIILGYKGPADLLESGIKEICGVFENKTLKVNTEVFRSISLNHANSYALFNGEGPDIYRGSEFISKPPVEDIKLVNISKVYNYKVFSDHIRFLLRSPQVNQPLGEICENREPQDFIRYHKGELIYIGKDGKESIYAHPDIPTTKHQLFEKISVNNYLLQLQHNWNVSIPPSFNKMGSICARYPQLSFLWQDRYGRNLAGSRYNAISTPYDYKNSNHAIMCAQTGVGKRHIILDIDDPSLIGKELFTVIKQFPSLQSIKVKNVDNLLIPHTPFDHNGVCYDFDQRRSRVVYEIPSDFALKYKYNSKVSSSTGLELMLGRPARLYGVYVNKTGDSLFYHINFGTIEKLPKNLFSLLIDKKLLIRNNSLVPFSKDIVYASGIKITPAMTQFFLQFWLKSLQVPWALFLGSRQNQLRGRCPFEATHTTSSGRADFSIWFNGMRRENPIVARCYHGSCENLIQTNIEIPLNKIISGLKMPEKQIVKALPWIPQLAPCNINLTTDVVVIQSHVGSGKTYSMATLCYNLLLLKKRWVFLAPSYDICNVFKTYLYDIIRSHNSELRADELIEMFGDVNAHTKINTELLGLVSTHAYLGYRGDTSLTFPLAEFIADYNPFVFIDEFHILVQKCIVEYSINAPFLRSTLENRHNWERVESLKSLQIKRVPMVDPRLSLFSVPRERHVSSTTKIITYPPVKYTGKSTEYYYESLVEACPTFKKVSLPSLGVEIEIKIPLDKKYKLDHVEFDPDLFEIRNEFGVYNNIKSLNHYLMERLKVAYGVLSFNYKPYSINADSSTAGEPGFMPFDCAIDLYKNWQSYKPPFSKSLILIEPLILQQILASANGIYLSSATFGTSNRDFLEQVNSNMPIPRKIIDVDLKVLHQPKIDKLLFLLFDKQSDCGSWRDLCLSNHNALMFFKHKKQCMSLFNETLKKHKYPYMSLYFEGRQHEPESDRAAFITWSAETIAEGKRIYLSYLGSTLTVGANLGNMDVVIINLAVSYPINLIPTNITHSDYTNLDSDEFGSYLTQHQDEFFCSEVLQILGRVRRDGGSKYKVFVLEDCGKAQRIINIIINRVKSTFTGEVLELKVQNKANKHHRYTEVITHFIETGNIDPSLVTPETNLPNNNKRASITLTAKAQRYVNKIIAWNLSSGDPENTSLEKTMGAKRRQLSLYSDGRESGLIARVFALLPPHLAERFDQKMWGLGLHPTQQSPLTTTPHEIVQE